ncbi:MAG: hypothetical protein JOZ51_10915, partial [Chloroflexi bacterium]|nr:hypothetical protein [Chloroflexota bacterium]
VSAWRMSKDHEENGFVNVGGMPVITDPSKIRNGTPVFVFQTGRVMYMVNGELAVTPYGDIL